LQKSAFCKIPIRRKWLKKCLLENSTAVEISKRLVQRGLIKEVADPNDKRATRLVATDKGGLEKVHTNFLDCLNEKEKKELIRLLERVGGVSISTCRLLNRN
jgi:DNA-binding MarR family transcriptional regulator